MLLTLFAAAVDATPPLLGSDAWWSEFLRSPGFAGTAAVLAALLTFVGVFVNNHANRERAERDQWWAMFQRVEDNLATYSDRRATMVVQALADEAKTTFEEQLVAALVDDVTPADDTVHEEGSPADG